MTHHAALGLALLLALCGFGCAASTPAAPAPNPPGTAGAAAGGGPTAPAGSAPAAGTGAAAGAPQACDFRVGETCFATDTEACAAAGCKPGGCIVLESYPAQITCK